MVLHNINVKGSMYDVVVSTSGEYVSVFGFVKGGSRKVYMGWFKNIPKSGKAREAVALAMFPQSV